MQRRSVQLRLLNAVLRLSLSHHAVQATSLAKPINRLYYRDTARKRAQEARSRGADRHGLDQRARSFCRPVSLAVRRSFSCNDDTVRLVQKQDTAFFFFSLPLILHLNIEYFRGMVTDCFRCQINIFFLF